MKGFCKSIVVFAALTVSGVVWADGAVGMAEKHFRAIAAGDVQAVMADYGDGATLHWVGGPLDGAYRGADQLQGVWAKFAKAQGALKVKVGALKESANPAGSTVTANVVFSGKQTIKVRYALVYRQGRLIDEIWQIDPKLDMAGAVSHGKSGY